MTGVLFLLQRSDDFYTAFFMTLGVVIAGVIYALHWLLTLKTVPPGTAIDLGHKKGAKHRRIALPGERYHPRPYPTLKICSDFEVSLLPRTHMVGKYAVTWKLDPANIIRYLDYTDLPYIPGGCSVRDFPMFKFEEFHRANPYLDFTQYASEYGIVVLNVDPPLQLEPPPPKVPGAGTLGVCDCHGDLVSLSYEDRQQHLYIAGKTKTGKSTLLYNLALEDIKAGKGVAFLDPHGDTARRLLNAIPKNRVQDVIFLSGTHPVPLGIMQASSDTEAEILAEDIYTLLRGMSDTWGDRMDAILRNTLSALFSAQGCSFLDIYNFLVEPAIRQEILSRVDNPAIRRFWENYHPPNYPRGSEQPILSRMEKFVTGPTLSKILGSESGIDLYDVMQTGKILLVDTSRRSMGEQTGAVLGGLIVTKFYQSAMRRAEIAEAERRPFYLYIDEFQRFIASPLGSMLSETRKYGLSLTLAHQFLGQIADDTRKAVFGNVGTMAFFQMGYDDAKYLAHQLGSYSVEDLLNLSMENHEAIVRPATGAAKSYKIRTLPPEEPPAGGAPLPLPLPPPLAAPANKRPPHDRDADPEPTPLPETGDR